MKYINTSRLAAVFISSICLGGLTARAANTIDPNSVGATDVVQDPLGTPNTLTNPLADPLSLDADALAIGFTGAGELRIDNGSSVLNATGTLGHNVGASGTATINGPGSTWTNTDSLLVGSLGSGMLNVQTGGLVQAGSLLDISGTGILKLDGGSLVTDTFDNSNGGTFNFLAGSLTINSGINVGSGLGFPQNLALGTLRTLSTPASTTIAANRTLTLNGGSLKTNDLTVQGALQFNSGTLELTGGTVTGLAALIVPTNGTLRATHWPNRLRSPAM